MGISFPYAALIRGRMSTVQHSEVSVIDRVHRNIIGTNINTTDCFDVVKLLFVMELKGREGRKEGRKGSRIHL